MPKKDITAILERLPEFESRLQVRIDASSAFISRDDGESECNVVVRGELHASSGQSIKQDIDLSISIHDQNGRVIGTATDYISSESFFGFHTFEISSYTDTSKLSKIRLIPRKS